MSNLQLALIICAIDSLIIAVVFFGSKKYLNRRYYRLLFGINSATLMNILFLVIRSILR